MANDTPFDGRTALVTGASAGIGRETARVLARDGADVALAARRTHRLEALADELAADHGVEALPVPTDVRDEADATAAVERTVDGLGGLDVLVNNAGVGRDEDLYDFPTEDYRAIMETNADGVFFATRAALPHLRDARGHLVFVGSFDATTPRSKNPVYAASKWWLRGFAHCVEAVVGGDGVAVTLCHPSKVRTEIGDPDGPTMAERYDEGEILEPVDVAEAISFAARQERATLSDLAVYARDKYHREGY